MENVTAKTSGFLGTMGPGFSALMNYQTGLSFPLPFQRPYIGDIHVHLLHFRGSILLKEIHYHNYRRTLTDIPAGCHLL